MSRSRPLDRALVAILKPKSRNSVKRHSSTGVGRAIRRTDLSLHARGVELNDRTVIELSDLAEGHHRPAARIAIALQN